MHNALTGAAAGLAATAPMTATMALLHRQLPADERYPLPPRPVTMRVARAAGVEPPPDEEETRTGLTYAAHFGYGAAMGALYGAVAERLPGHPVAKGIAFGLGVWAGSYMGFLPAAGLYPPPSRTPARRTALMIAAHVVWGGATGAIAHALADGNRG